LSFISHLSETAAENAKKMEDLIFDDPSSSMIKARIFAEEILKEVFNIEKINFYVTNLNDRIIYLAKEGILTPDIQNAFNIVRMSGNKAAHRSDYNDIVEAFKVHRSMYKIALWFYETYSTEEITIPKYENPQPPNNNLENIEELVKKKILELLHNQDKLLENKPFTTLPEKETVNSQDSITLDLEHGDSYLLRELRKLQDSSKEAIENAATFSKFKNYLHVERPVQKDLETVLKRCQENPNQSHLVLLCGSVGDGKSHLLAYLKENRPELLEGFNIFNDATESFSPSKNSMETLEELLKDFSDQAEPSNKKVILAINLGVLHNFISMEHDCPFSQLAKLVEESNVFTGKVTTCYQKDWFSLINFGDYHSFELTKDGAESQFFSEILKKIFSDKDENPFYRAYIEDQKNKVRTMAHYNYELLRSETVQAKLIQLIVQAIIKYKLVISARAFLNFISDILIPENLSHYDLLNHFERLENSLPILLFNRRDRSPILRCLSELNPLHIRSKIIDETIIQLNTLKNWGSLVNNLLTNNQSKELLLPFLELDPHGNGFVSDHSFQQFSEAFVLFVYLTNDDFSSQVVDINYNSYLRRLYYINTGALSEVKNLYEEIKEAIFKWKGGPIKDYIYIDQPNNQYRLAQKLNLKPSISHLEKINLEKLCSFKSTLLLVYINEETKDLVELDIDFPLYELLQRVRNGYRPNKYDEEEAIKFIEFIDQLMSFGNKKKELLIHFPSEDKFYKLYRDDFDAVVFEREQRV